MGMTIKEKIMADTDNKELEERCERCVHFHRLKHNFKNGTGFEDSTCCDVLLHLPDSTDDIEAWVQEVSRLNICEMFTEAKQDVKAKPQEQEPKTGHWINKQHLLSSCSAECSSCQKRSNGYVFDNGFSLEFKYYDFCPNCGCRMVEPQGSEDT